MGHAAQHERHRIALLLHHLKRDGLILRKDVAALFDGVVRVDQCGVLARFEQRLDRALRAAGNRNAAFARGREILLDRAGRLPARAFCRAMEMLFVLGLTKREPRCRSLCGTIMTKDASSPRAFEASLPPIGTPGANGDSHRRHILRETVRRPRPTKLADAAESCSKSSAKPEKVRAFRIARRAQAAPASFRAVCRTSAGCLVERDRALVPSVNEVEHETEDRARSGTEPGQREETP